MAPTFHHLDELILSEEAAVRDQALEAFCLSADVPTLLEECRRLEQLRESSQNLYQRVRALFFLHAIHRYHLPAKCQQTGGRVPFQGYAHLLNRRFEEAIRDFTEIQEAEGPGDSISSALALAYHKLAFQTLADQVRRSVRSVRGNRWMFRLGHPADHPLRIRPALLQVDPSSGLRPLLREATPVRMDLTHSAWSDIFFLGMDFPEGARVLNISVDLAVRGRDAEPRPPVEATFRVIDTPCLRLTSVDLGASADITSLAEVFDFAKDYLGLLKAALIASGIVPPGIEGSGQPLSALLTRIVGPGLGIELVSSVRNIPKGSRLAVSTNLLASLIAVCMRATGQTASLEGALLEGERRILAARAILGEWLSGSGGGWQDSGGVWPGMKLIEGVRAQEDDPEFGVSRGCLLPKHHILDESDCSAETRKKLQDSLVVVHGGMAQNVGPILEMVTEKYLLRSPAEWEGRREALGVLEEVLDSLRAGDIRALGSATTRNFQGPIQAIIPWASNLFTETLIEEARARFGDRFWGFWMLGGMSGGGMGFMFAPEVREEAQDHLLQVMLEHKRRLEHALPFAMDPVVYDFAINEQGTASRLESGESALQPDGYYLIHVPGWLRRPNHETPVRVRNEQRAYARRLRENEDDGQAIGRLFDQLFPDLEGRSGGAGGLRDLLEKNGFDPKQHEAIRADIRGGRIGLSQNALPANTVIEDVRDGDVLDLRQSPVVQQQELGREALKAGRVAVVTLAAGVGSRWTDGAGVVKALNPFCRMAGRHRNFLQVHLAKSRRTGEEAGIFPEHVVTTSYLTHGPIAQELEGQFQYHYPGRVTISQGRSIGLRLIPMVRDLRFLWEETPQEMLDEQAQKMRESVRAALLEWARQSGEASDYTDNLPSQCLHPVGHWFEVPNLLLNGTLKDMLDRNPALETLMLHNIDTLGASLDPGVLGAHLSSGACLSYEVISRRVEDRGGGLARVNGRVRLVEGLAMPREDVEFDLSFYNSMTTWIQVDALLAAFGLDRESLGDPQRVAEAVRNMATRLPTYVTLKDVKKRWGHGQEDVFPVAQFEKLWGDMTALPEVSCSFLVVPRERGQQLKDPSQLDGWLRDGSAAHVESLGSW